MRYMVHFAYKDGFPQPAEALLPAEGARVQSLIQQGTIEAFYFAADRSQGWVIANNRSREEAEQVVSESPLFAFWQVDITAL